MVKYEKYIVEVKLLCDKIIRIKCNINKHSYGGYKKC